MENRYSDVITRYKALKQKFELDTKLLEEEVIKLSPYQVGDRFKNVFGIMVQVDSIYCSMNENADIYYRCKRILPSGKLSKIITIEYPDSFPD